MSTKSNQSTFKFIFRLLPVAGVACLIQGFGWAVHQMRLDATAWSLLGVGMVLFLTLFVKAEVANLKYYVHVIIYSLLMLGICVVVYLFSMQYTRKLDLTKQKMFSLSAASVKMLNKLDKEVKITFFSDEPDAFQEIENLYTADSSKVSFEVVNARTDPMRAQQIDDPPARNGDFFVQCVDNANKKRLSTGELAQGFENTLSNAILEVTREIKPKLYFLNGHGELAYDRPANNRQQPNENPPASLQAFRDFLIARGMVTEELSLTEKGFVPKDASMLIIAGPQQDLDAREVPALEQYLKDNGKLLVLLDVPKRQFGSKFDNLVGLLGKYGIEAPDKIVLDMFSTQLMQQPIQPLLYSYDPNHPITAQLGNRSSRFTLSLTRPVFGGQPQERYTVTELIKSSPASWSEDLSRILASNKVAPPPKSEMSAQSMGVAVSRSAPPQIPGMNMPTDPPKDGPRLVVYGTSQLIQDSFLERNNTAVELMLNTVTWLNVQEDMIAALPRMIEGTPIELNQAQIFFIFFFTVVGLPAALFFGGLSYSMLRRRK